MKYFIMLKLGIKLLIYNSCKYIKVNSKFYCKQILKGKSVE